MEKTKVIVLRVSPDEKGAISAKAALCRLGMSEYLRKLAREHELRSAFDQEAVRQIRYIGRNLNQAVYAMHRGDFSEAVKENFRRCLVAVDKALGGAE